MGKLKKQEYRGLRVNWNPDVSPLDTKMLDRVLDLMEAAVEKRNIKPILSRFDFPNARGMITAPQEVKEFFRLIKEELSENNCYFKKMKVIEGKKQIHFHAICIYDGKKIKNIKQFNSIMQRVWRAVNPADKLNIREESNYYNLSDESGFNNAFYASSYLCKESQAPKLSPHQKRYTSSHIEDNVSLTSEELQKGLMSIKEICILLNLSKSSVWNKINSGMLQRPIKLGNRSVWKKKDIFAFIDKL